MGSPDELTLIATIADELPCGVWVATAPDGRFVYANRAFNQILGLAPRRDVGIGEYAEPYGIFGRDGKPYPEDRMPFTRALRAATTVVVDDIVLHRPDGHRAYIRASAKPMFDASGRIAHVAVVFFDITSEIDGAGAVTGAIGTATDATDVHNAQEHLARCERLASVGMLAAGVAHEINNPLSYVIGNLEMMAQRLAGPFPANSEDHRLDLDEMVADARQGAERVRTVVRDLKVFSGNEDCRPSAVDVRTSLSAAVNRVIDEARHRARVVLDLKPAPLVWADEGRIAQLFFNLVLNAVQAIPEGAAEENEIRIVTGETHDGQAFVEVIDTGVGIPHEALAKIFDPFFPFFTTKPIGVATGLGLSICHAVVTDLGGRIEVDSVLGKGTVFRVRLPASALEAGACPPPSGPSEGPRRRARVLVVDDEPAILKVIAGFLTEDHEVAVETGGAAALERLRNGQRFDVILCDLMMPQFTGMDLYDAVLEIAPQQARAMLFMTGGAFTPKARHFLARIEDRTLEKPFDAETLASRVRALVDQAG